MSDKEKISRIVEILAKYRDDTEDNYCCADAIEHIAEVVGFSFAL